MGMDDEDREQKGLWARVSLYLEYTSHSSSSFLVVFLTSQWSMSNLTIVIDPFERGIVQLSSLSCSASNRIRSQIDLLSAFPFSFCEGRKKMAAAAASEGISLASFEFDCISLRHHTNCLKNPPSDLNEREEKRLVRCKCWYHPYHFEETGKIHDWEVTTQNKIKRPISRG